MSKELAKIITDQIVEPVDLEKLALEKYPIQMVAKDPFDDEDDTKEDLNEYEREAYLEGLKKGYELGRKDGNVCITYKDKVMPTTDNSGNIDGYCLDGENEFAAVKVAVENGYLKVGDKVIVQIRKISEL